jgi:hypothetical protein
MVGILAQAKAPVTDQERADMLGSAGKMQIDDLVSRVLHCCPLTGQASTPDDGGTARS